MLGHREMGVEDYLGLLRRRVWWIVLPLLITPLLSLGITFILPNRYTSRTLVLIEGQKVPEKYVNTVVNDDLGERLANMQEQILSRTRLQPIIERFGLYKDEINKVPMEDLIERMRKNVSVTAVKAEFQSTRPGTQGLPGFYIAFTADNPRLAQQVCAEITSMFMSENLKAREQSAQGTTEFLAKQLEDAKRKLDDLDSKLAAWKGKNLGRLPGQEQNNMAMLMTLNTQLDAVTQALNRAQQDRTYAETLLSQQLAAWDAGTSDAAGVATTLPQQLAAAQANLNLLEARYTPNHPDVVKARQTVEELKKKLDAVGEETPKTDAKPKKSTRVEPQNITQMRTTLHALDQEIAGRKVQQQRLQQQISEYQGKVASAPMIEEEGKSLTRDYQTAFAFYNDLLAKKTQSEMATDMERRQQGENFRVMDPANLPEKPSFPDRLLFTLGGVGGGLGLGFGLAFLVELRDKSLRSEQDIEFYLELPTLAQVPTVGEHIPVNGDRRHWWQRRKKEQPAMAAAVMASKSEVQVEHGIEA